MATYQCKKCGAVRDFKPVDWNHPGFDRTIHDPDMATCLRCFAPKAFQAYAGPMKDVVLAREEDALTQMAVRRKALLEQLEAVERTRELQKLAYEAAGSAEQAAVVERQIKLCTDLIVAVHGEIASLDHSRERFELERQGVRKGAAAAESASVNVQATSKKNKLYIGNRQFVSNHARSGLKNKRILDVPVWSWGLNLAWVEGGIKAKAQFKLKLDDSSAYHTIPDTVLAKLVQTPRMNAEDFLELCRKEGAGSLLWYNLGGENRPTWTALEIAALLRSGYGFKFLARGAKHRGETKIVLEP